ncbi:DUF3558 domain-containing protein [Streptomyces sp. NPDC101733]|uniref:DUF3558 domain-containing protein n=1 Tax=unclassified Streptomyces TaxID=2593676 RepID=UPI0037FC7565
MPVHVERKAVRRGVLPGIAMLTALAAALTGLTGCTDSGGLGGGTDQKNSGSTAVPAQPGKYRSLPQPCKAADGKKLKAMLPADDSLSAEQREQLYAGTADPSFDGDRRVGCRWSAQAPTGTLLLSVDFERVVSYDRATASDDDKAHQVFVRRLTEAHLPFPGPTNSPGASPGSPTPPPTGTPTGSDPASPQASPPPEAPAASGSPSGSGSASPSGSPSSTAPPELGSRVLEEPGDEAFLEDKLSPAGATAAQTRTVRIVFRTSNVIVTVEYSVQPSGAASVPPSTETQEKARQLAVALAERFNE